MLRKSLHLLIFSLFTHLATAQAPCEIYNLNVETGACNNTGGYEIWINFQVSNPPTQNFKVWNQNGTLLGTFPLTSLPLHLTNFISDGGDYDKLKVGIVDADCFKLKEFLVPDCFGAPCEIYDLVVETGDCNNSGGYEIWVDFEVANPGNSTSFKIWNQSGTLLGSFPLSSLPLHLTNFPTDGGTNDLVKVCIIDQANCCRTKEFAVPDCVNNANCEIYDLQTWTGNCTSDSTYQLKIDFEVANPGNTLFEVWANNGQYLGFFPLANLPLTIQNFPTNGGVNDVVKICINDHPDCCKTKEFAVPDCLGGDCNITNLFVEKGICTSDSTYKLWVKFTVTNPGNDSFDVWANNGQFVGTFPIAPMPVLITNFPTDGGTNDFIKVCIDDNLDCCATKEFPAPDCDGTSNPCKIYDLTFKNTPCICGQFFALLSFKHQNGGSGGFDVVGNGVSYGMFPYSTQQPIIIGPLPGNDSTEYEFVVRDHNDHDCNDFVDVGTVECPPQQQHEDFVPAPFSLTVIPNPATGDWINVAARVSGGRGPGDATVEVFNSAGKLVLTKSVADGGQFPMDISRLAAGVYRIRILGSTGVVDGSFVKN